MFELGLAPLFSRYHRQFLKEKSLPPVELPASVESCVDTIAREQASLEHVTSGGLWRSILAATKTLLVRAAGFSLLSAAAASASTLAGMRILSEGSVLTVGLAFAGAYFAMNLFSQYNMFLSGRIRAWVGLGGEAHLAGLVAQKLVRLSPRAAERQSAGNLKVLITSDVKNVGEFLNNAVRNLIPSIIALVVITPLIVHFGGTAGLLGVGVMLTLIPLSLGLNRISLFFQSRAQTELDGLTSLVGEWVSNIRLIRYLAWEAKLENDVSHQLRRYMKFSIGQHFMACVIFGLSSSWWMVGAGSVLIAADFFREGLDLSGFFGSLWLLTFLAGYLTHIPNTIRLYAIAAPSMARLAAFLSEEERRSLMDREDGPGLPGEPARVVFDRVTFAYEGGKTALRALSATLPLGQKIAVLGEIGSGKTTFLKVLAGEYKPTEGRIWIEDRDGNRSSLWHPETYARFRQTLATVPQEPFVAQDQLARNITLTDDEPSDRVLQAAYFAELEADLAHLPRGVNQEIGEGGVNLSGGQRQRLNLARAMFAERPSLLLDDTLSAVDLKTESRLMEKLTRRAGGFVLITHRIQELGSVDRVIVLKDGSVVEEGSPATLRADPNSHFQRVLRAYEKEESFHE